MGARAPEFCKWAVRSGLFVVKEPLEIRNTGLLCFIYVCGRGDMNPLRTFVLSQVSTPRGRLLQDLMWRLLPTLSICLFLLYILITDQFY